jgi:hypothetical protein
LFFAKRAKSVFSIEDNAAWFREISRRIEQSQIGNVTMKLCPFDFKKPDGFEESDYLNSIPEESFDVIVVDGSEEWARIRAICFAKAQTKIRKGGIIVVDDSWRYPEIRNNHSARSYQIFQSVGPCRPGVTSTDVFFY